MSTKIPALGLVLTAGAALASFAAPARAYTVYTSFVAWQSALSGYGITTETFSNTIPSAQSIMLDSGIVSTNSTPPTLPNAFDNNSVNVVTPGADDNATQAGSGSASNTILWLFPSAVHAFGAEFYRANTGRLTLAGDFDGTGQQTLSVDDTIGACARTRSRSPAGRFGRFRLVPSFAAAARGSRSPRCWPRPDDSSLIPPGCWATSRWSSPLLHRSRSAIVRACGAPGAPTPSLEPSGAHRLPRQKPLR